MILPEDLKPVVYALTLKARNSKKQLWLSKGFARVNRRKDFLFNYWLCRLQKENPADLHLYSIVLTNYQRAMEHSLRARENALIAQQQEKAEDAPNKKILATPTQMITSASTAALNWVKSGLKTLSEEQIQARLDVCKSCDLWDKEALNGTGRCRKCGCSTWAKIRMASESCPEKKWLAIV
jgi:hypothetical protein